MADHGRGSRKLDPGRYYALTPRERDWKIPKAHSAPHVDRSVVNDWLGRDHRGSVVFELLGPAGAFAARAPYRLAGRDMFRSFIEDAVDRALSATGLWSVASLVRYRDAFMTRSAVKGCDEKEACSILGRYRHEWPVRQFACITRAEAVRLMSISILEVLFPSGISPSGVYEEVRDGGSGVLEASDESLVYGDHTLRLSMPGQTIASAHVLNSYQIVDTATVLDRMDGFAFAPKTASHAITYAIRDAILRGMIRVGIDAYSIEVSAECAEWDGKSCQWANLGLAHMLSRVLSVYSGGPVELGIPICVEDLMWSLADSAGEFVSMQTPGGYASVASVRIYSRRDIPPAVATASDVVRLAADIGAGRLRPVVFADRLTQLLVDRLIDSHEGVRP